MPKVAESKDENKQAGRSGFGWYSQVFKVQTYTERRPVGENAKTRATAKFSKYTKQIKSYKLKPYKSEIKK